MSKDLVIKANALVEASYQLTANEQRLILSAISKIETADELNGNKIFTIQANDFIALGVHPKTAYREMEKAMEQLFQRTILVKQGDNFIKTRWVQTIGKVDKNWVRKFNLMSENELVDYSDDWCIYGIQFSHQVVPFLTNLTANFTKYKLSEVAEFRSAYAFRFYEFIMQFQSTGYVKVSLQELRNRLQLGDKYPATKDLRMWVIETAIKEINEKTSYKLEYSLIKTGKKFTHLELKFKQKPRPKTKDTDRDPNTPDMLSPIKMTDKQRAIFASKLSELGEMGDHAPIGMTKKDYAKQVENDLLDPQKAEFYRPYLAKVGFTFKQ